MKKLVLELIPYMYNLTHQIKRRSCSHSRVCWWRRTCNFHSLPQTRCEKSALTWSQCPQSQCHQSHCGSWKTRRQTEGAGSAQCDLHHIRAAFEQQGDICDSIRIPWPQMAAGPLHIKKKNNKMCRSQKTLPSAASTNRDFSLCWQQRCVWVNILRCIAFKMGFRQKAEPFTIKMNIE